MGFRAQGVGQAEKFLARQIVNSVQAHLIDDAQAPRLSDRLGALIFLSVLAHHVECLPKLLDHRHDCRDGDLWFLKLDIVVAVCNHLPTMRGQLEQFDLHGLPICLLV